jgi:hypothetical protein
MAYGKSIEEVATKFDIEVADRTTFVSEKKLEILDVLLSMVAKNLKDDTNYITEFAVCDANLIAPKTKYGAMAIPSLCVIEAKREA